MKQLVYIQLMFILAINCLLSQSNYKFDIILQGLHVPWEIKEIGKDLIVFTQRDGYIHKFNLQTKELKQILKVPDVFEWGEGGLLGLELHPDFPDSNFIYIVYNYGNSSNYKEKVVKYRFEKDTLIDPTIILDGINASSVHNGSRLMIGSDRKLYVTTGDANNTNTAPDTNSLNGKLLRINLDGSIPEDNPFGNAVWSLGHRNAQGLVEINGKIFISEHGPNTDDEINIIERGGNYGWPYVLGYCDGNYYAEPEFCKNHKVIEPLISLYPNSTLAVCGIDYYSKDLFPELKGSLLMVTLKTGLLLQIRLNDSLNRILEINKIIDNQFGRLRVVRVLSNGNIIIGTSNYINDKLILIEPISNSVEFNNNQQYFDYWISDSVLKINLSELHLFKSWLEIIDVFGNIVHSSLLQSKFEEINLKSKPSGIYFLKISNAEYCFVRSFLLVN